jgi:hypothetical protein
VTNPAHQHEVARHICCVATGIDPSQPKERDPEALTVALVVMHSALVELTPPTTSLGNIKDALKDLRRLKGSLRRLNWEVLLDIRRSTPELVEVDRRIGAALRAGKGFARAMNERFEADAKTPEYSPDSLRSELDRLEQALNAAALIERRSVEPGRTPNRAARGVALAAAQLYFNITGNRPTYRKEGATKFAVMLADLFAVFEIKADIRRPAEWAIGQISAK